MALNQYPTLICALPQLPVDCEQPHVPISRPRLESYLRMLTERDWELVIALGNFWRWEFQDEREEAAAKYARLVSLITDAELLGCVDTLADIRMLAAAIRTRLMGREIDVVLGRWGKHIKRNQRLPDFGLTLRFPWLGEFTSMLENKQYSKAERAICRVVWREMAHIADHHYFDLLAVISYIIRWDLINRWAARDHDKGLNRFNTLVEEVIGEYA